jgi:hypothetical protein
MIKQDLNYPILILITGILVLASLLIKSWLLEKLILAGSK